MDVKNDYKKGSGVILSSYMIRPTQLGEGQPGLNYNGRYNYVKNLHASGNSGAGYRIGKNTKQPIAADMSLSADNTFTHADGINVAYEDGAVIWRTGFPKYVLKNYASYPLTYADSRFKFFIQMTRGVGFIGYPVN
jgi:hypothetical protein